MGQFYMCRPQPFPFSAQSGATIALTDGATNSSNTGTYTFSGIDTGTAASGRETVMAVATRANPGGDVTAIRVHVPNIATDPTGTAASVVVEATGSDSRSHAEIWQISNPTGTTADIVVSVAGTPFNCSIQVYEMNGVTAAASDTGTDNSGDPLTVSIDVPASGVCVAALTTANSGSVSWTGLNGDSETTVEGIVLSVASDEFATLQTGLSVEGDMTAPSVPAMAVASWGPV